MKTWCQICHVIYDDPNILPLHICQDCSKKCRAITQSDITKLEERTKDFISKIENAHKQAENSKLVF